MELPSEKIKKSPGGWGVLASSARALDSPSPWAGHGVWRQRSPIIVLWFYAAVARTNWRGLETNSHQSGASLWIGRCGWKAMPYSGFD